MTFYSFSVLFFTLLEIKKVVSDHDTSDVGHNKYSRCSSMMGSSVRVHLTMHQRWKKKKESNSQFYFYFIFHSIPVQNAITHQSNSSCLTKNDTISFLVNSNYECYQY